MSHRENYIWGIVGVEGVNLAQPLTGKGANHVLRENNIRFDHRFPEWRKMKNRILEVMQRRKKEIEDEALEARCVSRVDEMRAIIRKFRRTLDPHDFCPSMEDVWGVPDIRKVIIDGTDEEFNARANSSELPMLASKFLDERAAKISALVPFTERPDDILSLATVWFKCGLCESLLGGTSALGHHCPIAWDWPSRDSTGLPASTRVLRRGWCIENFKFSFSKTASAIARGLILDCGEDPERITLTDMNSKFHRFALSKNAKLAAYSWDETVRPSGLARVHHELTIRHTPCSCVVNFATPL